MITCFEIPNFRRASIITALVFLLTACSSEQSTKMPEDVAKEFVEAIYNTKDLETAKRTTVAQVAGVLDHYRSIKMIQRHVMQLTLDFATVKVNDVGTDFFRKSKKDTKVELHIRGRYEGGIVADDRYLTMTWTLGEWKVKRISKN